MVDLKKIANPAPLGLAAFGMTTVLFNLHNAGFFGLGAMIIGMGLFYGGLAQIIAGILEFKNQNTFGLLAFTSYGFFWLSLVFIIVAPSMGWAEAPSATAMGFYLLMWGIFSMFIFVGTLRSSKVLQFVVASLILLFFLLALAEFTGIVLIKTIAGFEGIICGASALYLAMAKVLNETFERNVLPIGSFKK